MKIIVIGASGTVRKEVVNLLASVHEVVKVGNHSGDFQVDIGSKTVDRVLAATPTIAGS